MGFLASWLIMAAWISVPPAVVMAIVTFISRTFGLGLTFGHTMIIGIIILVAVFLMSMQDIQFLVKAQAVCLFANITTTLLTGVLLLFSGHWSFANVANLFQTNLEPSAGIPGWIIGMALLITPFFGFETVPQMVEEGDFPTSNTKKAICGSVLTCGTIYVFFFFCVAGLDSFQTLLSGDAQNGFMTITAMQNLLGWKIWPLILWLCFYPHGYDRFDPWLLDVHCPDALLHGQEKLPAGDLHQGQLPSAAHPAQPLPAGHQPDLYPAAERHYLYE